MKLNREELNLILGALNILRSDSESLGKDRMVFNIDLLVEKLLKEK